MSGDTKTTKTRAAHKPTITKAEREQVEAQRAIIQRPLLETMYTAVLHLLRPKGFTMPDLAEEDHFSATYMGAKGYVRLIYSVSAGWSVTLSVEPLAVQKALQKTIPPLGIGHDLSLFVEMVVTKLPMVLSTLGPVQPKADFVPEGGLPPVGGPDMRETAHTGPASHTEGPWQGGDR